MPLCRSAPRGAAVVFKDVTDQVEAERRKEELIRVAIHELTPPVTVMKGYAEMLLSPARGLGDEDLRMLAAIGRADRMARIIACSTVGSHDISPRWRHVFSPA